MERKIGEIFEFNGEWCQCVGGTCRNCSFYYDNVCRNITTIGSTVFGNCHCSLRADHKSVIFKKLEKVGEPVKIKGKLFQTYKRATNEIIPKWDYDLTLFPNDNGTVAIEIKQNKEDMEEKKIQHYDCFFDKSDKSDKSDLKPFNLEAAKAGKPVCTRDGRKARIICFDRKWDTPIIALIADPLGESVYFYLGDGRIDFNKEDDADLMLLPEKKEGWVNVYRDCDGANITRDDNIYSSKEAAIASAQIIDGNNYVATTKINWEE